MVAGELFRMVRRRSGLSQRELARRLGVAASTVAGVESGVRQPSLALLTRALDVAGLELAAELPAAPVEDEALRYLTWSTTWRLAGSLGVAGRPSVVGRRQPVYAELVGMLRSRRLTLHGEAARALWLRPPRPLDHVEVCDPTGGASGQRVEVVEDCEGHVGVPVAVPLSEAVVYADPPAELARRLEHAHERSRLRGVARVLDAQAARDAADRRTRSHAEPRHVYESEAQRWLKRVGPLPDLDDRRGWRLRDVASARAWLEATG